MQFIKIKIMQIDLRVINNQHQMPLDLSERLMFFEAEPFLKNSHLISHLKVYKNEQVFVSQKYEIILFMDKAIHIYSYQQMLRDEASLVHIVEYEQIFKMAQAQQKSKTKNPPIFHMDYITQIFNHSQGPNHPQTRQFGEQIFEDPNNINSNILLQGNHFINRLTYLNEIKVKHVDLSVHGDLLINFVNGRSVFLQRDNSVAYYKKFQAVFNLVRQVDLCTQTKSKIQFSSFVDGSNNLLVFYSDQKIIVYNYLLKSECCSINYTSLDTLNQVKAFNLSQKFEKSQQIQDEKTIIMFQHPQKLQFYQFFANKKKMIHIAAYENPQIFIQKVFIYPKSHALYISTAQQLLQLDLTQLLSLDKRDLKLPTKIGRSKSKESQKSSKSLSKPEIIKSQVLNDFQRSSPQEMLYINDKGNFFPKCKNTSKQYLNLIFEMTSGVFICVTCKKQGNYKEGQLLIGVQQNYFDEMIRNCSLEIKGLKRWEYLNFEDLNVVSTNSKLKKETVSKLSKLLNDNFHKFSSLSTGRIQIAQSEPLIVEIQGIKISQEQFEILAMNLGSIFDSKEKFRQKLVQKKLINHLKSQEKSGKSENKMINIQSIKEKCIFTHKEIGDEKNILECKNCDLYGIRQNTDNTKICMDGLRSGQHRCYVCLNEMDLVD